MDQVRPAPNGVALDFEAIAHDFPDPAGGTRRVIGDVSFRVTAGRFTAVVGPSGCGKSTLLNFAAGLLSPSAGAVRHHGELVDKVNRNVGFVPQQAGLFPWKTLRENVEFPLAVRNVTAANRREKTDAALARVGLASFADHYPHQLSGGMQKRAAIARTLVYGPDVVLRDEPFGALDAQTRMVMQDDLQRLWLDRGTTVLFVTHDLVEAILLADNVVLLGRQPTQVKAELLVDLPRPRDVFEPFRTPGFVEAYERLWSRFKSEIGLSVEVGA